MRLPRPDQVHVGIMGLFLFLLCVMSVLCSMCSFDGYELKSWLDIVMDAWMVWFLFMLVLGCIHVMGGFELSYMFLVSSMMVWFVPKAYFDVIKNFTLKNLKIFSFFFQVSHNLFTFPLQTMCSLCIWWSCDGDWCLGMWVFHVWSLIL